MEKVKTTGSSVSYDGNCVYENGSLKYILTSEGRVLANDGSFNYEYNLKERSHASLWTGLGNVRVVVDGSKTVK